jgi:energy-coupling factor transporter transmembrane protein EcfT
VSSGRQMNKHFLKKLYPLTYIIISFQFGFLTVILPEPQSLVVLAVWCSVTLMMPSPEKDRITKPMFRVMLISWIFLFLIHGIRYYPLSIDTVGMNRALDAFTRFAAPALAVVWIYRRVEPEEMYALLIDLGLPISWVVMIFRIFWLVPRFMERLDDVLMAQRLRGMKIESYGERMRAVVPSLFPVITSLFEEITENSLVQHSRGLLEPGKKTHVTELNFSFTDISALLLTTFLMAVIWFVM